MLKALLQIAATLALIAIGGGVAVLSRDAHRLLVDADVAVRHVNAVTGVAQQEFEQDRIAIAPLIASLDGTVAQVNLAAQEQRAYWQKTSADSDKTVKALRLTVDRAGLLLKHTDEQLNGSLLPDFDRQLSLTSESAQASFSSITHAGDALTFQIDDLQPIFANLGAASANVASGTGHADKILLDGEKTADYYEQETNNSGDVRAEAGGRGAELWQRSADSVCGALRWMIDCANSSTRTASINERIEHCDYWLLVVSHKQPANRLNGLQT